MTDSIDRGLGTKPGRNPQKPDQEFGETRSLEEAFDDRGSIESILDGAHEKATGRAGRATAFAAGAVYLFEEAVTHAPDLEGLMEVVNEAGQIAQQYPEASTGALAVFGALSAYNVANEAGLVDKTGEGVDYVKDAFSEVDEDYLEITDAMIDEGMEPLGTPVNSEAGPEEIVAYSGKEEYEPSK